MLRLRSPLRLRALFCLVFFMAGGAGLPAASWRRQVAIVQSGYAVGGFHEPPAIILQQIDGQTQIRLESLLYPGIYVEAPVAALGLVAPKAPQTNFGRRVAVIALRAGVQGLPNRRFYRRPRIACAAFVSWVLKKAGRSGYSLAVNPMYAQVRRRHGVLVAARVSTRYTPYLRYYKPGDLLFFHRGNRLGHVEIYVGGGNTVGTSSSALRLGVRRIGNRGFATMSIVRV